MELHRTRRRLGVAAVSAGLLTAAITAPAASAAPAPCQVTNVGTGTQYVGANAVSRAIAAAAAGDTIEVSGTCAANVTVTQDITLVGEGKRATLRRLSSSMRRFVVVFSERPPSCRAC